MMECPCKDCEKRKESCKTDCREWKIWHLQQIVDRHKRAKYYYSHTIASFTTKAMTDRHYKYINDQKRRHNPR